MSNSPEDSSLVLDTRLEELDERIDQIEQETLRLQAALSAVDGRLYQLEAVAVTY
jgi:predicted nuclease with TOPRIM domain